ncbi:hypothetical protein KAU09_01515 [Candidatus Parcubacteria bacterium]|nr:hypothetical protein [Candidatus Parcubacteria bacterium]
MKKVLISLLTIIFLNIAFIAPVVVEAADKSAKSLFNSSLKETAEKTGHLDSKITKAGALKGVSLVISVVLSLIGVVFLILMIYGGFIWMNSRGNEQEVEKAKNIIRNSIIGLLIVIAAYAITAFIGDNLAVWVVKE